MLALFGTAALVVIGHLADQKRIPGMDQKQ
ncbi:MAG: hypothetical protein N838_04770 [Thiohalocapsa sp. PB-PSB1]|nr:MAG: hypothetical protein N838_04770 [Thiohalocapsa sp. PB-PSB1]